MNQRASAGALVARACETLIMTAGGTIGAATPVTAGTSEPQPADEKSVSYVRKEFRATAEARNRPPEIAEAMVDVDVEIAGLIAKGKLLTLTTAKALDTRTIGNRSGIVTASCHPVSAITGPELVKPAHERWHESWVQNV